MVSWLLLQFQAMHNTRNNNKHIGFFTARHKNNQQAVMPIFRMHWNHYNIWKLWWFVCKNDFKNRNKVHNNQRFCCCFFALKVTIWLQCECKAVVCIGPSHVWCDISKGEHEDFSSAVAFMVLNLIVVKTTSLLSQYVLMLWLGPTVFRGKFCQIPRTSLQNSAAHRDKIVLIPRHSVYK